MYPTDQQKRLQVAASVNPSLRSVANPLQGSNFNPQQTVSSSTYIKPGTRLGPVQVAHPGPLYINGQPIYASGSTAGAPDQAPRSGLVDFLEGGGYGVAKGFTGVAGSIPWLVDKLKAITPAPADHFINTAEGTLQRGINAPLNAFQGILQDKGYTGTDGNFVAPGGRIGARAGSDLVNAGYGLQAIGGIPKLISAVRNAPAVFRGVGSAARGFVTGPDGRFAIHAAEDLPAEAAGSELAGTVLGDAKLAEDNVPAFGSKANTPKQTKQQLRTEELDTGTVDPRVRPPADKVSFTKEEQTVLDQAGVKAPTYGNPVLHLPGKKVFAKLPADVQEQLANEVNNLKSDGNDIVHLSPDGRTGAAKEVSLAELTAQSPNAKTSVDNALKASIQAQAKAANLTPEETKVLQESVAQTATSGDATAAPGAPTEASASSVENQPAGLAETLNNSADANVTKLPTEAPKETGSLKRTFLSVRGELSKMGDSGQEIANRLKSARDTSETGQAWFLKQVPTVLKLKGAEFTDFVDTLEALSKGKAAPEVSPAVQQAVQEWSAAIPQVRDVAGRVGLDVGDLGPYYFPRNYSELLKNDSNFNRLANELVKSGQAANIGEAMQQLRYMKRGYSSKFGHFENSRKVDLTGYDKSKNALVNYVAGAFNKIGDAEQFGPKSEIASKLVGQIGAEGQDAERAAKLLRVANGTEQYNQPGVEKFSNAARAFNRVTKLGLSAILNLGQSVNTATAGGTARTLANIGKYITKNDREFIDASGVNADSVLSAIREQTGISGKVTGKLTAPGFNRVERLNRGVAALTGRDAANVLTEKAFAGNAKALESLRNDFGVEGDIGESLTPQQQIQAGRNFVERTQFKVDAQDLPAWANSPLGKMAAQFRTFSYKQQKFMWDEVVKQARSGNVLPLIRFTTVGSLVGALTGVARGALRGQPWYQVKGNQQSAKATTADEFYQALNNVGVSGLFSGPIFVGQNLASGRLPQYVASSTLGPTAGLAVQTVGNVGHAFAGSPKALERQGLATVPVAGAYLSNKIMPYKPTTKGQGQGTPSTGGFASTLAKTKAGVSNNKQQFLDALSPTDKQYFTVTDANGKNYAVSTADLTNAYKAGHLNKDEYEYAMNLHQVESRIEGQGKQRTISIDGKSVPVPDKANALTKEYYSVLGKTNKDVLADWKAGKGSHPVLDSLSQQVASQLDKQRPKGLKNLKPSPDLVEAYAKLDAGQTQAAKDGKPWDAPTQHTKIKSFWVTAVKGSQTAIVKDIYKRSGKQLQDYFIKNKQVSMSDVKAAVGMDNALYKAGLISRPHFSKKFRNSFGFGLPTGPGGKTYGSGSGHSRGLGSTNAMGTLIEVRGSDGLMHRVRVGANGLSSSRSIGLSQLAPSRNIGSSMPSFDFTAKTPRLNIPTLANVTGVPIQQRVVSPRYKNVTLP